MARASNNPFPSVLIEETAAASIPTPDAGQQRLFIDTADDLPKLKDSTGTVAPFGGAGGDFDTLTTAETDTTKVARPDGAGGVEWGTESGGASELDYATFTSAVTVTATSEATANTVVTGAGVAYDGSTDVMIEFFSYAVQGPGSNGVISLVLYDGSSSIGTIAQINQPTVAGAFITPVLVARRLTPSAATHTYSVRAFVNTGSGSVYAGSGGVGNAMPGFIRITKAA